jgi:hypothetical protein
MRGIVAVCRMAFWLQSSTGAAANLNIAFSSSLRHVYHLNVHGKASSGPGSGCNSHSRTLPERSMKLMVSCMRLYPALVT